MGKGTETRPTRIRRGASARDLNFVWCVRCGSVSERAELSPQGARQARLAGLARKGCDVRAVQDLRDKRELQD